MTLDQMKSLSRIYRSQASTLSMKASELELEIALQESKFQIGAIIGDNWHGTKDNGKRYKVSRISPGYVTPIVFGFLILKDGSTGKQEHLLSYGI